MGAGKSREKALFYAIEENNEMLVLQLLKADASLADAPLLKGRTTPLCRAVTNNRQSIVMVLL